MSCSESSSLNFNNKIIPDPGLSAETNPTRVAEFDDQSSVSENKKLQDNAPKKKKQSAEQYESDKSVTDEKIEIVYRIKKSLYLFYMYSP